MSALTDTFRARFIPSGDTLHQVSTLLRRFDQGAICSDYDPTRGRKYNPHNVVDVPAAKIPDVQTLLFGAFSHSLSVRPHPPPSCGGCGCQPKVFNFDLAADMFGPSVGSGSVTKGGCCDGKSTVVVNLNNVLGDQALRADMDYAWCNMQPRYDLTWSTGETVSYRGFPRCGMCCCTSQYRVGFVAHVDPARPDLFRYVGLDSFGVAFMSAQPSCCSYLPLGPCCCQCSGDNKGFFTSWMPMTLSQLRSNLLQRYAFGLKSEFDDEPRVVAVGNGMAIAGTTTDPTVVFEHRSDVNALGNVRLVEVPGSCCQPATIADPTTTADPTELTSFDITFRGALNQNQISDSEFKLVLGYLIMRAHTFGDLVATDGLPVVEALRRSVTSMLYSSQIVPGVQLRNLGGVPGSMQMR